MALQQQALPIASPRAVGMWMRKSSEQENSVVVTVAAKSELDERRLAAMLAIEVVVMRIVDVFYPLPE